MFQRHSKTGLSASAVRLLAFTPLLLACARDARALTLLSDDRFVRITQYQDPLPPLVTSATPDVPFGPFHYGDPTGPAYQDSEMTLVDDPNGFDSLKGSVSGGTGPTTPGADYSTLREAVFSIHFRIDGPSSALFTVSGVLYPGSCVTLNGQGHCGDPFEINFGSRTSIEPGDYELRATAPGQPGDMGGLYNFRFSIAENVPEPGTALLLALGLAGLRGVSTRRRIGVERRRSEGA